METKNLDELTLSIATSRSASKYRVRGFSLIELLAVILIIGLSISLISINVGSSGQHALRIEAKQFANSTALLAEEAVLGNQQWGVDFFRDYYDGTERVGYRWLVRNDDGLWLEPDTSINETEFLFSTGTGLQLELDGIERELEIEFKVKIVDPSTTTLDIVGEQGVIDTDRVQPELWLLSSGEMTAFQLRLFDEEDSAAQIEVLGDELGRVTIGNRDGELEN